MDNTTLEWAAKWIEGSLAGETNERVIEFGRNMAMTIRAAVEAKAELGEQNDSVKAETAPCLPAVVTTKDNSLNAAPPPSLPREWVKVDDQHLPDEDDICLVWAREREYAEGKDWWELPWEDPEIRMTRGWWVIENGNTLTGAAERQARARFFESRGAKFTAEALYWALITPAMKRKRKMNYEI